MTCHCRSGRNSQYKLAVSWSFIHFILWSTLKWNSIFLLCSVKIFDSDFRFTLTFLKDHLPIISSCSISCFVASWLANQIKQQTIFELPYCTSSVLATEWLLEHFDYRCQIQYEQKRGSNQPATRGIAANASHRRLPVRTVWDSGCTHVCWYRITYTPPSTVRSWHTNRKVAYE